MRSKTNRFIPLRSLVGLAAGLVSLPMATAAEGDGAQRPNPPQAGQVRQRSVGKQILKGELLIEGINQQNYIDADDDGNDRASQLWLRAQLGAKLVFDEFVEAEISMVYDGEGGDVSGTDSNDSQVEINDAFLLLKGIFRENMHIRLGRQPVVWNLRPDYGAFLFDSRANKPVVTSWDGARAYWEMRDDIKVSAFFFLLDEARESQGIQTRSATPTNSDDNALWGLAFDWQPEQAGDDRLFVTASITLEQNPRIGAGAGVGDELLSYYMGLDFELARGYNLWAEGSFQDGDVNDTVSFDGFGVSGGVDYRLQGPNDTVLGIQADYLSGDGDPGDDDFEGFTTPWEGTSDTYIVEHERYGELSELLVGNLFAIKAKAEYGFFEDRMRLKAVYGHYELNEDIGGASDFGDEIDLKLHWTYTYNVSFGLFGGYFMPGDAYKNTAAAVLGTSPDDDDIYFVGANAQVLF